jgi:hypothetical protein
MTSLERPLGERPSGAVPLLVPAAARTPPGVPAATPAPGLPSSGAPSPGMTGVTQAVGPGAAAATDAADRTAARHRPAVRAGSAGIRPR